MASTPFDFSSILMPPGSMSGGYNYNDNFWRLNQLPMDPTYNPNFRELTNLVNVEGGTYRRPDGSTVTYPTAREIQEKNTPIPMGQIGETPSEPSIEVPHKTPSQEPPSEIPEDYSSTIDPKLIDKLLQKAQGNFSWGKALAIGALAMTNPQLAYRMLEQDEEAKNAADQMLTQLGIQEAAGKRDFNRQKVMLEMQDKKLLAAEQRQQKQLEAAEIRGWEDEAARLGGFAQLPTDRNDPEYRKKLLGAIEQGRQAKLTYEERRKQVDAYMAAYRAAKLPPPSIQDPYSDAGFAQLQAASGDLLSDSRLVDFLRNDAIKLAENVENAQAAEQAWANIKSPTLKQETRGFVESAIAAARRPGQTRAAAAQLARERMAAKKGELDLITLANKVVQLGDKGNDNLDASIRILADLQNEKSKAASAAAVFKNSNSANAPELYTIWAEKELYIDSLIRDVEAKKRQIEANNRALGTALGGSNVDADKAEDPKAFQSMLAEVATDLPNNPVTGFDNTKWLGTEANAVPANPTSLLKYMSDNWQNEVEYYRDGTKKLKPGYRNLLQRMYYTYLDNGGQGGIARFMDMLKLELQQQSNDMTPWFMNKSDLTPERYSGMGFVPSAMDAVSAALSEKPTDPSAAPIGPLNTPPSPEIQALLQIIEQQKQKKEPPK